MNKRDRIKRATRAGAASKGVPRGDSSRRNGRLGATHGAKGGRPRNAAIQKIINEHGCSRQYAYSILKRETEG